MTKVVDFKDAQGNVTDSYQFGDDVTDQAAIREATLLHQLKKTSPGVKFLDQQD